MPVIQPRRLARSIVIAIGSLAVASVAVGWLQDVAGIPNPSAVYLIAVVATALSAGPIGAIAAAVAAFLLDNFLFTAPRYSLSIADPAVWLSVVLLLFVGVVVGQLAALQRARTALAQAHEREALALFRISRVLATRDSTVAALGPIAAVVRDEVGFGRVWVALGPDDAAERIAADTGGEGGGAPRGLLRVLRRTPGDAPAEWVRVHLPAAGRSSEDTYRVRIETPGLTYGSIWGLRDRARGIPDRSSTRLIAAAADQIGQALAQDQLAGASRAAEVARQSDALKSSLLQTVSHDLRTPLAAIRMAASTLGADPGGTSADRRGSADLIEREVEHLNRLVTNLLDVSRIEAGGLRIEREVVELDDVLGRAIASARPRLGARPVEVDLGSALVAVDPILLDAAFTNVLENAIAHASPDAPVRISATPAADGLVRLTVEDGGPGVAADALPRLFDKFYRAPGRDGRPGSGIGLAVTRGFVEAMGGRATARASGLGGLAVDLDLPAAVVPPGVVG